MKKKISVLALLAVLALAVPVSDASAKAYYCTQAYLNCAQLCGNSGLFSDGCKVGCAIGYWNC